MKKVILSALFVFGITLTSCGPTKKDAIKYNHEIVAVQNTLTPIHQAFINQLDGHNVDSLKMTHANFMEGAKTSLEFCEKIQPFADNRDYLDASIEYFKVVKGLADNEGKSMVEIMSKDSAQISDADIIKVNEVLEKFNSGYEKALVKAQAAQEAFAKEWKFELIDKQ